MPPRLALTLGDPAGIGPEICLRVARDPEVVARADLVLVGSAASLERVAGLVDCQAALPAFAPEAEGGPHPCLLDIEGPLPVWGGPSAEGGALALGAVRRAASLVRRGICHALVTAPVDKAALALAGSRHRGHTALLAELDGAEAVFMLFMAPRLAVVLATDHIPLREVPAALTRARIVGAAVAACELLERAGRPARRIAVAGLNPHAGEGGMMGGEETETLAPAVSELRARGYEASGPHPGDSVYRRAREGAFDLVVAPYHDQGLVAVKTSGLGEAVHVTTGLSFLRTSVDHGTAYDIAGTGRADPAPLKAAVLEAARISGG